MVGDTCNLLRASEFVDILFAPGRINIMCSATFLHISHPPTRLFMSPVGVLSCVCVLSMFFNTHICVCIYISLIPDDGNGRRGRAKIGLLVHAESKID